jgi:Transposase and inactivated derivatives
MVSRPHQVWAADTLEFRIGGQRAFLALLLDIFTRLAMGFAVSFNNDTLLTLEALEMALKFGKPEIHHSDQGKTYAAEAYVRRLGPSVLISMAAAGKAWENGYAERLNWTFESEEILLSEYQSLQEARTSIASYVNLYNEQRIHQGLGDIPPREAFEAYGRDQSNGCQITL